MCPQICVFTSLVPGQLHSRHSLTRLSTGLETFVFSGKPVPIALTAAINERLTPLGGRVVVVADEVGKTRARIHREIADLVS